jgi:ComF family protein
MSSSQKNKLILIKDFFLDLIFPKFCVGCKKEGEWFCISCKKKIIYIKSPACPYCNRLTKAGQLCSRCREKSALTGVIISAYYENGPLKEAIHTLKYDGVFDLKYDLSQLLIKAINFRKLEKKFILIPVPLHKIRKAERGYNQTELLVDEISKEIGFPIIKNKLLRIKNKAPQITLSGAERRNNVKGIFKFNGGAEKIKNKNIILVDDVFTTGSTLEECAKILRENGAKEVWGLVLAKG